MIILKLYYIIILWLRGARSVRGGGGVRTKNVVACARAMIPRGRINHFPVLSSDALGSIKEINVEFLCRSKRREKEGERERVRETEWSYQVYRYIIYKLYDS